MTETVAPLSAAEVSKIKFIVVSKNVDEALMKKIDERVNYIWREIADMAGIYLEWWDYTNEARFNCHCHYDTEAKIGVKEGSFFMPRKPTTELEEAMGLLFKNYEIKLKYLFMPDDEWKADCKRDAEILLAAEKKRKEEKRAKEAAKKKTEQELLQQALEELKKIKSPEDIKSMSINKRTVLARFINA